MPIVEPGRRTTLVACLLIVIVTLASWWPRIGGPIDLRWDGGAYYIVGTSLAEGKGYRLLSEPGEIPSSVHAPFLPVLVAAHQLILQTSDPAVVGPALRLTVASVSIAYSIAIFFLLRAHVHWAFALTAALIGVLQPQYVYFSDALYAETFFGLFTVLFFILQRRRERLAYFLLAGLCAAFAYEARTAGIALLAAWVIDNLLRRDFKRASMALVIAALPVVSWMGWIGKVERSPEYRQPAYAYQTAPYLYFNVSYARNIFTLKDPSNPHLGALTTPELGRRVLQNLQILPLRVGEAVSTWTAPAALSIPLALTVFVGLALLAVGRQYLMLLYIVLSLAAVLLTPFNRQFVRYLLPLYPFFALAMFLTFARLAPQSGSRTLGSVAFMRGTIAWVVVGFIAIQNYRDLQSLYAYHDRVFDPRAESGVRRLFYYAPLGTEFDESLDWLRRRADRSDVVASTDPQWTYLQTGMKAVLPPFEQNGRRAQQLVDTVPVKYLIVETRPQTLGLGAYRRYTAALLRENPGCWTLIWQSGGGNIEVHQRTRAVECGSPDS